MKVIIIKQYQKYKVDDIIEVSNGFGTNFLIKTIPPAIVIKIVRPSAK